MKLVLCDEDRSIHDDAKKLIYEYETENNSKIEVEDCKSLDELISMKDKYDAVFLNIDTTKTDGDKIAKKLRENGIKTTVIAMGHGFEEGKEAFKIEAKRFVTKPIEKEELYDALNYIKRENLGKQELPVIFDNTQYNVKQRNIRIIEAKGDYQKVYVYDKQGEIRETLNRLEEELDPELFIRVHKSYLINMMYVTDITKNGIVMADNKTIPVSRRKYKDVVQKIKEFEPLISPPHLSR